MKKILSLVMLAVLLLTAAVPVAADNGPSITMQPQNYQYPEYSVATYSVKASGSNLHCYWYLAYEGKIYELSDNTNGFEPWEGYAGENYGGYRDGNTFTWFFGGIEEGLNGAEIWCVIEDGHYSVTSERAIITVQGSAMPPEITAIPAEVTANRGDNVDIRCVARSTDGSQLAYTWYETSTGKLQNIQAMYPEENSDFITVNTSSAGVRYYVCGIETGNGGRAYSSVVKVNVLDSAPAYPDMEILTKKLPDGVVGQEYEAELLCNDPYGLFTLYYNPGKANQLEESGLRLLKENVIVGTPKKAGTFTFTVCAAGDYGEDYMEYTITIKKAAEAPEVTEPIATEPDATEPAATDPNSTEPIVSEPDATAPDATVPEETQPVSGELDGKPEKENAEDIGKPVKDSVTTTGQEQQTDKQETQKQDTPKPGLPWWGFVLIGLASVAAGFGVAALLVRKKE